MICEDCGKEVDTLYYGFMLSGEEYEFEKKARCGECTKKIKIQYKNKIWRNLFKLYLELFLEKDQQKSNILLKKIENIQLGGKKHD
jgi:DNA-directed RNA polymerase subunit RPC12/RpoP